MGESVSKVLYPILFLIFGTLSFSIDLQIQVMDGLSPMAEGHRLDLMNGNLVVDSAYTDASV